MMQMRLLCLLRKNVAKTEEEERQGTTVLKSLLVTRSKVESMGNRVGVSVFFLFLISRGSMYDVRRGYAFTLLQYTMHQRTISLDSQEVVLPLTSLLPVFPASWHPLCPRFWLLASCSCLLRRPDPAGPSHFMILKVVRSPRSAWIW